ncbi:hypothetical protein [Staphylococcus phage ASZ22RN]|nr:hypothetical protein [Staphylococcus phage ASZ22RN]
MRSDKHVKLICYAINHLLPAYMVGSLILAI